MEIPLPNGMTEPMSIGKNKSHIAYVQEYRSTHD